MPTFPSIYKSEVGGYDYEGGSYIEAAYYSGVRKYTVDDDDPTADPSLATLYAFPAGATVDGDTSWTLTVHTDATAVDAGTSVDAIPFDAATVAAASPSNPSLPGQGRVSYVVSGDTTVIDASVVSAQAGSTNETPYVDLKDCCSGVDKPFVVLLLDSTGTANEDYDGDDAELRVYGWGGTIIFTETVTITGNSCSFTVTAAHNTANAGDVYDCAIVDTTNSQRIVKASIEIESVPIPT